jgi:putative membrane protein
MPEGVRNRAPFFGISFLRQWKKHPMKNIIFIVAACCFLACGPTDKDSVKQAHTQNINSSIDEEVSEFLTEAADARMMDLEEGKLAASKGSTAAVRIYGEQMVKDQTRMLTELRIMAASKNIVLPTVLSHKKAEALESLKEKNGEEFDKEFVDMMQADHKRDVDEFEDAVDFKDPDIKQYAKTYIPVIQNHLDNIVTIKDSRGVAKREDEQE